MKISELTYDQRCHLAWRLDHNTGCGLLTAISISKLQYDYGQREVLDVFKFYAKSDRSAKILTKKVENFKL